MSSSAPDEEPLWSSFRLLLNRLGRLGPLVSCEERSCVCYKLHTFYSYCGEFGGSVTRTWTWESVQHRRQYTKMLEPLDKVTRCCYSCSFPKVSPVWNNCQCHNMINISLTCRGGRGGLFALPLLCGLWHQSVILLHTVEGLIFIWFLLHWWICWCSCQRGFSGQNSVPVYCTL